jgi:CRP-like cAMP-binding protein
VLAAERISLLRRLHLFAPLPPPDLERLALASRRHAAVTGEVLIVQADVGDRFYAVESGRYRVDKDGETVAVLGTGDLFGEIALLYDVPRTASVTCIESGTLVVLDREPFLVAISRARPSRHEA